MASHHPDVYLTFPQTFKPLPDSLPRVVLPPVRERTVRAPFGINSTLYNFALQPAIPLVFASAYILTVFWLNGYNRRRGNKPWWISRQPWFNTFVVVHNVLLSVYSFATFCAMFRAISVTLPGWDAQNWRAETADALCKLHGPRGIGDAATFNTTINIWEAKNALIKLGYSGNPDPTDVGRLWNEGLAFWGWLFYVSKFYEVIDTLIILAKGKRSATLQTYHHAGAMLCMWAGIRYMSPPIWMFVFINSAIHAMMYTYFTLSALGYKVPQTLKRVLTSLQIAQFVFGASYAALHLFIQYDIPQQIPYHITSFVETVASSASQSATSAASAVSSFAESPLETATMGSFIKKMLLRAAGEEGVAERVGMEERWREALRDPIGVGKAEIPKMAEDMEKRFVKQCETRYRTEWTRVNCIDTSGEAFAIYLNLLYLAPLTFLFARFFVRAYTQRGAGGSGSGKSRTASQEARRASGAAKDAKNQTEFEIERQGTRGEEELQKRGSEASQASLRARERVVEELREDVKALREGNFTPSPAARKVSDRVQSYEERMKGANGSGHVSVKSSRESLRKKSSSNLNDSAILDDSEAVGMDSPLKGKSGGKSYAEATKEETEVDTDAMGKSGSIVDYPVGEEKA